MNNLDGKENCQAFVETLGLGILFPLFMKPSYAANKKNKDNANTEGSLTQNVLESSIFIKKISFSLLSVLFYLHNIFSIAYSILF